MATYQTNIAFDNSTDAAFRAWGSGFSTGFAAVGLVQTSDTGQINWTTVTRPTGSNAVQGYEMWRFSDSLQATKPIFIKIEYGAPGNQLVGGLWVTVGTATNGAGTITGGLVTSRLSLVTVAVTAAYASPLYISGDTSSVNMMSTLPQTVSSPWTWQYGFSIERSRNSDGTVNGDGCSIFLQVQNAGTSATQTQYISFATSTVSPVSNAGFPCPIASTRFSSFNTGASVIVFPMVVVTPKVQSPPLGWLCCGASEFPRAVPVSVTMYGTTHTYLPITGGASLGVNSRGLDQALCGLLMRWE